MSELADLIVAGADRLERAVAIDGSELAAPPALSPTLVLEDEGCLFLRYGL